MRIIDNETKLRKKIFLASSKEALPELEKVALWIEDAGHEPVPWNKKSVFRLGDIVFERLIEISKEVDAAVLIFNGDDYVSSSKEINSKQPRDNVLIEYGIFAGVLGRKKAIMCCKGRVKIATDLEGIIYCNLNRESDALITIKNWLKEIVESDVSLHENIKLNSDYKESKNNIKSKKVEIENKNPNNRTIKIFSIYFQEKVEAFFDIISQKVTYNGEVMSVSRAANKAKFDVKGKSDASTNGWKFWKYSNELNQESYIEDLRKV